MANPKVKKRYGSKRSPESATQEALNQPDEIEEGLVGLWEFVRKYRYVIVGGMGVALVAALAGQFFTTRSQAAVREDARKFNDAIALYSAVVQEPGDDAPALPDGVKSFPTEAKKLEAVKAELTAYASSGDGALTELAQVAQAAATFQSGDYAGSESAVQTYLAAHADSPLAPALKLQRAYALHAQGKAGDAAGVVAEWGNAEDWWYKSWSALASGDMETSPEAATKKWKEGLAVFDQGELSDPAAKFVKAELERRIAQAGQ